MHTMPSTNAIPQTFEGSGGKQRSTLIEMDPEWDAIPEDSFTMFSGRGWVNMSVLFAVLVGIVTLFVGYPVLSHYLSPPEILPGFNIVTPNSTLTNSTTNATTTGSIAASSTNPLFTLGLPTPTSLDALVEPTDAS